MSINNFIPAKWSGSILKNLEKNYIYVESCNRDYEGDIKNEGDQVKINSIGNITVKKYVKNTPIDPPETLTGAQTILFIDQADYINFVVDDIDKAQQTPKLMDPAMERAGFDVANEADKYVAGLYVDFDHDLGNITITKPSEAYELLVDMAQKLDENNVPQFGRTVIINPAFRSLLRKDPRFTDLSASGQATLKTGEIGMVAGMTVKYSNNVPVVGDFAYITAFYTGTISFAGQIIKMEAFRPESGFGDAVKGLHVYGAKVVRPNAGVYAGIKIDLA